MAEPPDHHATGHGDAHDHDLGGEHEHEHPGGLRGFIQSLLRPHSHDAADSVDATLEGSADGIRAVKVSLLGLGATATFQILIFLASGSIALLADTIHNFSDALTAVPLWIAFVIGRRAPTRTHTYGYGRLEDVAGIFIVAMIALSSIAAGWASLDRLLNPQPVGNLGWVAVAAIVGFLGNEGVALYRIRIGERIGSAALVADGYHARTDGLASLAVLVGAAGVWLGFALADPIIGLVITLVILFVLKDAATQIWRRLMDAVDPALVARAEAAALETDGVEAISTVRMRWIGHALYADAELTADCELTLEDAHTIAERARHAMLHAVPKLSDVTVHIDPCAHSGRDTHADLRHHSAR